MESTNGFEILGGLRMAPSFTAAQARKVGLHPALLSYYAKLGKLKRVGRGVYLDPQLKIDTEFQW